jgi:hypothetical protein
MADDDEDQEFEDELTIRVILPVALELMAKQIDQKKFDQLDSEMLRIAIKHINQMAKELYVDEDESVH